MRMRLLLRRLTVSAPRMSVRSAMPWPVRWIGAAVVLGFCAAIALWAFEFGKEIAGIDDNRIQDLTRLEREVGDLRRDLESMKEERDKALALANTSTTLMTAEKAALERLSTLNKQLEVDNQRLRDDLGFFEKLIPTVGTEALAIRGLQAEVQDGRQVKWQVLVIQPLKNAPEFTGRLEISFTGLQAGRPWTSTLPEGPQAIKLRQYARAEGVFDLPPQTLLKGVSVKVMDGSVVKAVQSIKL
jgi:regulator of replication initiation timing